MKYTENDHTFVICAYQENPYLEECIVSVLNQSVLGNVLVSTSTPNAHIMHLTEKYKLPLVVNMGKGDGIDNLNFGYLQAETQFVTVCHQDDYFLPDYLTNVLSSINHAKDPIIIFTDYFEDRSGAKISWNKILLVKRILNFPLQFSRLQSIKWLRKIILSLGDSICCPSVTYNKNKIRGTPFEPGYLESIGDWAAWIRLSKTDGEFIYISRKLMSHRIWKGSATSEVINSCSRSKDEYELLSTLWPESIAKVIFRIYHHAQNSNRLGK